MCACVEDGVDFGVPGAERLHLRVATTRLRWIELVTLSVRGPRIDHAIYLIIPCIVSFQLVRFIIQIRVLLLVSSFAAKVVDWDL